MKLNLGELASSITEYGLLSAYELVRTLEKDHKIENFSREEHGFTWGIDGYMFEIFTPNDNKRLGGTIKPTRVNKTLSLFMYSNSAMVAATVLAEMFDIQRITVGEHYATLVFTKDGVSILSLRITKNDPKPVDK